MKPALVKANQKLAQEKQALCTCPQKLEEPSLSLTVNAGDKGAGSMTMRSLSFIVQDQNDIPVKSQVRVRLYFSGPVQTFSIDPRFGQWQQLASSDDKHFPYAYYIQTAPCLSTPAINAHESWVVPSFEILTDQNSAISVRGILKVFYAAGKPLESRLTVKKVRR